MAKTKHVYAWSAAVFGKDRVLHTTIRDLKDFEIVELQYLDYASVGWKVKGDCWVLTNIQSLSVKTKIKYVRDWIWINSWWMMIIHPDSINISF